MTEQDGTTEDEATAWRDRARDLAAWADRALLNRRDIFGGQYVDRDGRIRRVTRKEGLCPNLLALHFAAEMTEEVIGAHATAPDETCRWAAIDVDAHPGQGACPEANLRFARAVRREARRAGLDVRLIDSGGGRGGFHIWVVFDGPIPMAAARRLALWLARDWAGHGLPGRPDLFPGNERLTGKGCGNWLRLPGRHHKRPCWARVWSPRARAWLAGDAAIEALLTLRGRPVDVAAIVPADFPAPAMKGTTGARAARPPGQGGTIGAAAARPMRHGRAGDAARDLRAARVALEHYRNDDLDYDAWLEVGMALRNLDDEEAAFSLWDRWSAGSGKYDDDATADKWESFRPAAEGGGIGLGTLFHRAMANSAWPGPAYIDGVGAGGSRRLTHRSGRRGLIMIPARVAEDKPGGGRGSPS